jgi:hypothetical protein
VLGQDGLKKLREWYRLEKERRRKAKGTIDNTYSSYDAVSKLE